MEKDGAQNVMTFLAKVKNIVGRLDKAGASPNNTDIMEVMKSIWPTTGNTKPTKSSGRLSS